MRKIITITHLTVDGVMQGPGGPEEDPSNGFTHGGWSNAVPDDDVADQVMYDTIAGEFDLLLGRRTYDIFASYWPNSEHPVGKAFDKATKYVITRGRDELTWANSKRIGDDAVAEICRLKASEGPELHIWGSGNALQTLIAADLIDEYRMWIYPVVLGVGKRFFEQGVPPRMLSLAESKSIASGVVLNTYRPAGPLPR